MKRALIVLLMAAGRGAAGYGIYEAGMSRGMQMTQAMPDGKGAGSDGLADGKRTPAFRPIIVGPIAAAPSAVWPGTNRESDRASSAGSRLAHSSRYCANCSTGAPGKSPGVISTIYDSFNGLF